MNFTAALVILYSSGTGMQFVLFIVLEKYFQCAGLISECRILTLLYIFSFSHELMIISAIY